MYEGKTLAPILCMHRSASSLMTNVLFELGMSLGPFTMITAKPDNPHGFFEAAEFCDLNRAVQNQVFGFADDMPWSPEGLQRFVASEGRWPDSVERSSLWLDQGEDLVRRLVASGAVSSFKDPRVPLLWPFWAEVFQCFPGLRVIPIVLLRSPHEIAMSIFMRSKGRFDYCDVLDVTAIHFRRIGAILADWPGPLARIRFLPEYFTGDLRATCRLLGLAWSEEVYSRVFDVECKHHEPAAVAHPAQAIFEQLTALPAQELSRENAARVEADALVRERLLRRNQVDAYQREQWAEFELAESRSALASMQIALATANTERLAELQVDAYQRQQQAEIELAESRSALASMQIALAGVQAELTAMQASVSWKLTSPLRSFAKRVA